MKYLKPYKLFESLENFDFPTKSEIQSFFYDVTDDDIAHLVVYEHNNNGWMYWIYPSLTREVGSAMYYDMQDNPDNWIDNKTNIPYQTTWREMFIDITDSRNSKYLVDSLEYLTLNSIAESKDRRAKNRIENKSFKEELQSNILKGVIRGIPFFKISLYRCLPEKYEQVTECIERMWLATGWRPIPEIWIEDYVDETGSDVSSYFYFTMDLVRCSDDEYKALTNAFCIREKKEKELVKLFL